LLGVLDDNEVGFIRAFGESGRFSRGEVSPQIGF
jgi:hypothetical protein